MQYFQVVTDLLNSKNLKVAIGNAQLYHDPQVFNFTML